MFEDKVQKGKVHLGIGRRIDSDSSDEDNNNSDSEDEGTSNLSFNRNNTPNLEVKQLENSEEDASSNNIDGFEEMNIQ